MLVQKISKVAADRAGPQGDPAAAERRTPVQPWRPGFSDKARAFLLSRSFQSACQLALGALLA